MKNTKEKEITVVACYPNKPAEIITIPNSLKAKQDLVGGYIEAAYPFPDPVAIICNEEGKINGLDLNRALYNEKGEMVDIIAGPMLVCGLSDDDFTSLNGELLDKYYEKYKHAEAFVRIGQDILAIKLPEQKTTEEQSKKNYKHR